MLSLALLSGGREHILSLLAENPAWKKSRLKSPEGAAQLMVQLAKQVVIDEARAVILPDITNWYAEYEKINGPPPPDQASDWYEGHDDGLLGLFEAFTSILSASWLHVKTTEARIWEEGEDEKLANAFGEEVWKQLTWQRTPNQILAGIGIVTEDLAQFGTVKEQLEASLQQMERVTMGQIAGILNRVMLSFPDPAQLRDNLEQLVDDDDTLASGAAARLGVTLNDAITLRQARMEIHNALDAWQAAIEAGETLDESTNFVDLEGNGAIPDDSPSLPQALKKPPPPPPPAQSVTGKTFTMPAVPPPPPPPPAPAGTAEAPARAGRGRPKKSSLVQPPPGAIPVEVLQSIKDHAGLKDEIMAEIMGISRPTLANVMKGKTHYVPPDPSRRKALSDMLGKHINELEKARQAIVPL